MYYKPSKYNLLTYDSDNNMLLANTLESRFVKITGNKQKCIADLLSKKRIEKKVLFSVFLLFCFLQPVFSHRSVSISLQMPSRPPAASRFPVREETACPSRSQNKYDKKPIIKQMSLLNLFSCLVI